MKKLVHEPLLHFLLLGAAIFAAHGLLSRGSSADPGRIVVTQGQVAAMTESYLRTRQRAPNRDELEGLIRDRVQEEVYYREALALGLDKDDLIIRRRLRQKMEFVSQDLAAPDTPGDAQLQAYLNEHAATFATEPRFSFRQVYLDPQRHGANLSRDASRLLAGLNRAGATANLATAGDPLPMEHEFDDASAREVRSAFGEKFASALADLPQGQWQGPVESGFGAHVVFITKRKPGGLPPLEEVRATVVREWSIARQREASSRYYQALLRKYTVTVEMPSVTAGTPGPVAAR